MRKIRDVLRLKASGLSKRQIAASLSVSPTAVLNCLRRAEAAGLNWPLPDELTDEVLALRLYPPPSAVPEDRRPLPDWAAIHRELKRPGVTLQLLWQEHRSAYPEGYGYSRYCELYRGWRAKLSPVMRQTHVAGERLFVDYAGTTLDVYDGTTGDIRTAQLFVATLGASSYTYAEATWTQNLADWIGSHRRAFAFFGGVSAMVVCDNLKSGITKACFYEPAVNRSYAEMAAHYGTAIVPARPYKPRDKAKVEVAVLLATRWIIAKLRNRRFFSLTALNDAIRDCVVVLNDRVSRHLGASRRALFETLEHPALKALPSEPYVYAEWKECRVGLDYHVEIEKHYYSVPHPLLRETLWARITLHSIELFHHGRRVAAHVRSSSNRKHTTVREHMPSSHRRYADWTPERLTRRAGEIGAQTSALVEIILRERTHPEQGFRSCVGIIGLSKSYGAARPSERLPLTINVRLGGLRPGARHRRALLHLRRLDPEDEPGSFAACFRHRRAGDRARQYPWPHLLPLRRSSAMLTHPTIGQLRALKLDGMADAFVELLAKDEARDLTPAEWLALLADREIANRATKRFQTRLRSAHLRHSQASVEDVDFRAPRQLDKTLFQDLATCRWIKEHRNLTICGPCGIGKSWLACALAQKACRDGHTVHYARVPRLFSDLELAHGDGRFAKVFRTLTRVDLLVLDDWGPDRLTASQRRDLMEIVEDRYGAGSTLITSQLPLETWHEVIGEPTFADAILDRIVHNAYRLSLKGASMRKSGTDTTKQTVDDTSGASEVPGKSAKGARK